MSAFSQAFFILSLYLWGTLSGIWLFARKLPAAFFCVTGFLWGALAWVLFSIACLVLSIPYTLTTMAIGLGLLFALILGVRIGQRNWPITIRDVFQILGFSLLFLAVSVLVSNINYSAASNDSAGKIFFGRSLALDGLIPMHWEYIGKYAILTSLLQSPSVFLGEGYMYTVQPTIALSLFLSFIYLGQKAIPRRWPALLAVLAMFSTLFIIFQTVYIHDNLAAGAYLFISVVSFWFALRQQDENWLVIALLGLLGFSLCRVEGPIYAIIFLALFLMYDRFPLKVYLRTIFPYLGAIVLWYLVIFANADPDSKFLSPANLLLAIATYLAFGMLIILSRSPLLRKWIVPNLSKIMIGSLTIALVAALVFRPEHILISLSMTFQNLYSAGLWGVTWGFLLIFFILNVLQADFPYEKLFSEGIVAFFLLLIITSVLRKPYRLGWGDSANRMITHIFPILFYFILLKYRLQPENPSESSTVTPSRSQITTALVLGIAVLVTLIFICVV